MKEWLKMLMTPIIPKEKKVDRPFIAGYLAKLADFFVGACARTATAT